MQQSLRGPLVLASLLLASTPFAAHAATRVVDDDGRSCRGAQYASIQAAVDAAAPGDTIKVCAGLYPESVWITKTLRIHGAKKGKDARRRRLGGTGEAVVQSPRPFLVEAPRVVIDGFSIVVSPDPEGEGSGIRVDAGGSGYRILNNVFEDAAAAGIELVSVSGTLAEIRQNHFRGHLGVRGEFGRVGNLVILDNLFVNASIAFIDWPHEAIHIQRNVFRYDESAHTACLHSTVLVCRPEIRLEGVENVLVSRNKLNGSGFRAIRLSGTERVRVVDNVLRDGTGVGIEALNDNPGTEILGNRLAGYAAPAIHLANATGLLVEGNEVEASGAGIVLRDSRGNRIASNNVEDNATIGIDVGGDENERSIGNDITANESRGNGVLDCRDRTTGDGTAGTGNAWVDNEGSRSDPQGLCPDR